jgi:hypothetical protein
LAVIELAPVPGPFAQDSSRTPPTKEPIREAD